MAPYSLMQKQKPEGHQSQEEEVKLQPKRLELQQKEKRQTPVPLLNLHGVQKKIGFYILQGRRKERYKKLFHRRQTETFF